MPTLLQVVVDVVDEFWVGRTLGIREDDVAFLIEHDEARNTIDTHLAHQLVGIFLRYQVLRPCRVVFLQLVEPSLFVGIDGEA